MLASATALAQTNPAPQTLPYSQNFDGLAHSETTYPAGWQGWTLSTAPGTAFLLTPAIAPDRLLVASSSASTTSGNVHNYNQKIGFLNTSSLDFSIALALNTTGRTAISVSYDIMTIRNPHDGNNTRINEVILQYRVGTTGNFINLAGTEYQNNTTNQTTAVTTPQNLQPRTITLPAEANNQPVVQLRWASRQISGSGSRPSFAVDNISVTGQDMGGPAVVATPVFSPNGGEFYSPVSVSLTSATAGAAIFFSTAGADGPWTPYTAPINLSSTATLWAYASAAGMTNSSVASAVFTFPAIVEVASIAQLRQQAVLGTTVFRITGEVLMTYSNVARNQKYFQDPNRAAGIKVDDPSGFLTTPLQPGDGVRNLLGTLSNFNNMLQFVPIQGQSPAARSSTGNVIEPLNVVLGQLINPDNFFRVGTVEFSAFQGLLIRVPQLKFEQTGNFDRAVNFGEVPVSDPTASLATIAAGPKGVLFRVEYADLDYNNTPIPQNLVNLTAIVDQRLDVARIFARSLADFNHILISNNARLQTLTLGGRDALPLSGIVVNDTVADAGATMFVSNFASFAGIVAAPEHAGATFSVTRNGTTVSPANLATVALNAGDVVVVRVLAEDGQTRRFYKVTLAQEIRTLTITLPVGGETYQTGQLITVNWTSQNVARVHLQVFKSGVADTEFEVNDLPAVPGVFSVNLPNGVHGPHFFRLVNAADPTHFVTSANVNFVDNVAPAIERFLPAHNSVNILLTPTFTIEADENVRAVTSPIRNIRLHRVSDNSLIETLPVTSTQVVVVEDSVSFSFATRLSPATAYQITVDAGAFVDINSNPLPGIAANVWRFTTQSLICNGDFEAWTGGRPDCWFGPKTNLAAASVLQYTAAPQSGLSAVRLIRTETTHQRFTSQPTSVTRGHTYRISFWAKGGGEVRTGLFDDRPGESFGYIYNPYIILNSAVWQQFTQDVVADNTTGIAEFIFSVRSTVAVMNHIHIDNVTITEIPVVNVSSLTELRTRAAGETVRVTGEVVLSFQQTHRNQKFFQDAAAAIMVDDPTGRITTVYALGSGVRNLTGTLVDNNGMLQLVPISDPGTATSTGNALVPAERTLATLTSADQARLVIIRNVRFETSGTFASPMNYNLTSTGGTGVFRTIFPAADYIGVAIPTQHLNLTAIVSQFQAQMQVTARNLADFEVTTNLPQVLVERISIFPNPFSNYITISSPVELAKVSLVDNTGRVIAEYASVIGSLTIPTENLQPGLYFIRIVAADGTQRVEKLLKR